MSAIAIATGALLFAGLLAFANLAFEGPAAEIPEAWRGAAEAHGLQAARDHWFGTRAGYELEVRQLAAAHWEIRAALPSSHPTEVILATPPRGGLDQRAIGGRRWSLGGQPVHPAVLEPLEPALASLPEGCRSCVVDRRVTLEVEAEASALGPALDAAVAIAHAVPLQRLGLWSAWMERLGLDSRSVYETAPRVEVDGVALVVPWPVGRTTGWELEITGILRRPLPRDTWLKPASDRGMDREIGDLFVDTALQIDTSDPDALKHRLARDEVRGPLLDLLCSYPRSAVSASSVHHRLTTGADEVVAAVDRVIELVRALDQGPDGVVP